MKNLTVIWQRNGAGAIYSCAHIFARDFAQARPQADTSTAVYAAHVPPTYANYAAVNRCLGHGLGHHSGVIHASGGLLQFGDHALAHPFGIGNAMGAVTKRAIVDLGDQHTRLRTPHIQYCQQIFCLLAHALFL